MQFEFSYIFLDFSRFKSSFFPSLILTTFHKVIGTEVSQPQLFATEETSFWNKFSNSVVPFFPTYLHCSAGELNAVVRTFVATRSGLTRWRDYHPVHLIPNTPGVNIPGDFVTEFSENDVWVFCAFSGFSEGMQEHLTRVVVWSVDTGVRWTWGRWKRGGIERRSITICRSWKRNPSFSPSLSTPVCTFILSFLIFCVFVYWWPWRNDIVVVDYKNPLVTATRTVIVHHPRDPHKKIPVAVVGVQFNHSYFIRQFFMETNKVLLPSF